MKSLVSIARMFTSYLLKLQMRDFIQLEIIFMNLEILLYMLIIRPSLYVTIYLQSFFVVAREMGLPSSKPELNF